MNYGNLLKNYKVQVVLVVVALSLFSLFLSDANPNTFDAKLGLEFVGGVRIPVTLSKSVDPTTMNSVVETLKNRINSFGLSQAVIRPVGDNEVLVEIPRADESSIGNVKKILQEQGRFEAIIDGKQAVNGENVIAVGGPNGEQTPATLRTAQWSLSFTVTKGGSDLFGKAALGKAQYPVYMFLDRPENAAIILSRSELGSASQKQASDALVKEGDDIALLFTDEIGNSTQLLTNKSKVIISEANYKLLETKLAVLGFSTVENASKKIILKNAVDIAPDVRQNEINEWRAIGLLSAPLLSEGLASGTASQFYSITGAAIGSTPQEQETYALTQVKLLKSVISGGKLPVSALVGSSFSIEPSLGQQFLTFSLLATIIGTIVVALLVMLRYRDIRLSIPIIVVNIFEILILTAIIGRIGTIDLGAMAGIVSLIGTGVDDQLIITDEVLRRGTGNAAEQDDKSAYGMKDKIGKAFSIIFTTAGVAIIAMVPLLLSGIVEIGGFALSTIIGILIGVFITRPAFGVFIEELYKKE